MTEESALAPSRSNPNRPMKTNADIYESVARVAVHDTPAPNETVRIHVEHAEHDGGVCSFLCYTRANVGARIRSHLSESISTRLVDVDLVEEAGLGLTEAELLDRGVGTETDTPTAAMEGSNG